MTKKKKNSESEQGEIAPEAQAPGENKDQIRSVQEDRDDLLARLQRVSADYLNYQKRVQRDIEQARDYANEEIIKALLGVLDDMERALEAANANHDADDPLMKGMQLVHDKAAETLGKFGLERIDAEGEPFDPDKHSAMMQEPSDEHPPQTVLRELQKGYLLKGRTIRPSAVVVSTAAAPAGKQEDEGQTEEQGDEQTEEQTEE